MMFTGTNQQQDTRFSDKEKKLMKQMKFGDCLNKRVDMSKVKLDVLRPWISKKITDILNIEDDVVVEFVYNQLEEEKFPCPKKMQINMTGFLNGRNARQFMGELWSLLLSAQDSESGIPAEFIQQKKDEILKREEDQKQQDLMRSHDRSRSRDRDRGNDKRRSGKERYHDGSGSTPHDRETQLQPQLPLESLTAIEQISSQLSKHLENSGDEVTKGDRDAERKSSVPKNANSPRGNPSKREMSKSPNGRNDEIGSRNHRNSPHRRSRDRSSQNREAARGNQKMNRYGRSSRDRDRRRSTSRQRSTDRRRQRSGSRGRNSGGYQRNRRRKSRSASLGKRRFDSRAKNRRSGDDKSRSPSPEKTVPLTKTSSPRSKASTTQPKEKELNGRKDAERERNKNSCNRSPESRSSAERKKEKAPKNHSRSRSRSNPRRSMASPELVPEKRSLQRSKSPASSVSLSPENPKMEFDLRKNKNSVQTKRHYRNNRDSSASSTEKHPFRGQGNDAHRNKRFNRRFSPGRRSPHNKGDMDRSYRSRSRNRSRSRKRSRSPRRFNNRRSPPQYYRGRGGNNRMRMNHWRRSQSRGWGGSGGGQRFERRFSPQRRYSRERRASPMQKPFRHYSPPHHRPSQQVYRRPSPRGDRQVSPPGRGNSRDRNRNMNRWEKPVKAPNRRSYSAGSSDWEKRSAENEAPVEVVEVNARPAKANHAEAARVEERVVPNRSRSSSTSSSSGGRSQPLKKQTKASQVMDVVLIEKDEVLTVARNKGDSRRTQEPVVESGTKRRELSVSIEAKTNLRKEKYSSLSRTPSPFLKAHERRTSNNPNSSGVSGKLPNEVLGIKQKSKRDDSSSSEEESNESDDDDDEDDDSFDERRQTKKPNAKGSKGRSDQKTKSFTRTNDSDDEMVERSTSKNKKHADTKPVATSRRESKRDKDMERNNLPDPKPLKPNESAMPTKVVNTAAKARNVRRSSADSSDSDETTIVAAERSKLNTSRKRTLSDARPKKTRNSASESESDDGAKKKKTKASAKSQKPKESSSDSDSDSPKVKKRKKHKKHSKKSKKQKKQKKRSKKSESDSYDDEGEDERPRGMKEAPIVGQPSAINEDLERKLRERALKSMRKYE